MKPILSTLVVLLLMFMTSCSSLQENQPASIDLPTMGPVTMPANTQPVVEATSQAQASDSVVEMDSATSMPLSTLTAAPKDTVTIADNGDIFMMQVSESFLLNLGADVYDWTVEVDHQNILQRELNMTVIRGAQGIYSAQSPGTAILTASGNPLCLQSRPPCMRPTILFSITVIVQ